FDPTASVPLAGDADVGTVGGDLAAAAWSSLTARPVEVVGVVALALAAVVVAKIAADARRRRRRGRWGLLQDRFTELTGASVSLTNPQRAERLRSTVDLDADAGRQLTLIVEALDRAAFDPTWSDDGRTADYERVADAIGALERLGRRGARALTYS
ncbi:MAG: hypothetical protein ABWZ99_17425, partial [Ilumatobacteraceae bacterium]